MVVDGIYVYVMVAKYILGLKKMNDPEVMERIAAALERIAWLIGLQVGEE